MTDSLYTRLGGYDGIAMFATSLVGQAQARHRYRVVIEGHPGLDATI